MSFAFLATPQPAAPLFSSDDYQRQRDFFRARPELTPTPLHDLRHLAASLGIAQLLVKDETARFGLNAFKAAGAQFAVATLRERGLLQPGATVVCASEGNHGRAVARAAREAGCPSRVYVADDIGDVRVGLIEREGAIVVRVAGNYDAALQQMERDARDARWTVISDTATSETDPGIPRLVMLGYTRLMDEAEASWSPASPPDVIFVPAGVGGLLASVASWLFWRFGASRPSTNARGALSTAEGRPRLVSVEPLSAACVLAAARAGHPVTLDGRFDTIMAGLRCREVSHAALPAIAAGVDAFLAIEDHWVEGAMRVLATGSGGDAVVSAGASGAAALGGLIAALGDASLANLKTALQLGHSTRAMVFITEGVSGTGTGVPQTDRWGPEQRNL